MSTIRYPGTTNEPNPNYYGQENAADYAPDRSGGGSASSARDYAAAGEYDRGNRDRGGQPGRGAPQNRGYSDDRQSAPYRGSYAHDGHRFEDVGRYRDFEDDDRQRQDRSSGRQPPQGYGRQPQGYDYNERNVFARAGDEVRSWFGDEDAERRREWDARGDQGDTRDRHDDYRTWRSNQIAELDRDYAEYRRENQTKFHNEFSAWRGERQGQRQALTQAQEHMEVLGSDGEHVGTVDKVRGDRILLTRTDKDADGQHHTIPSRWIDTVTDKVVLRKTGAEAKHEWQEIARNDAASDFGDRPANGQDGPRDSQGRILNRSFSGTY